MQRGRLGEVSQSAVDQPATTRCHKFYSLYQDHHLPWLVTSILFTFPQQTTNYTVYYPYFLIYKIFDQMAFYVVCLFN